jgi:hypothetical protein
MVRHMVLWVVLALAVATAFSVPCTAEIVGLRMVGIGSPDDSLEVEDPILGSHPCAWTSSYSTTEFGQWDLSLSPDRIYYDINLLYSSTFAATSRWLTSPEIDSLLYTLDLRHDNIHHLPLKDLELVYDYLSYTSAYADTGFEIFSVCGDSAVDLNERNHVDIYLVKYGRSGGTSPCSTGDPKDDL